MHARERRNVSDIASLALLVDIYGKVSTVTQAVSPLPQEAGGNSEDEGKPCCENAIAHETDRRSEPVCWPAATGSLMNSYSMEASKILRSIYQC